MSERRKYYRKRLSGVGYVVENKEARRFQLEDLSLDGLGACFEAKPTLQPGDIVRICLPDLGLQGLVTVMRLAPTLGSQFSVGFCFSHAMLHPMAA
ncbi:PilZ domain-containing protein [Methylomagnum sp.]